MSAPEPRRRARLGRYAFWQLRDYLFEKAIATLFVVSMGILIDYLAWRDLRGRIDGAMAAEADGVLRAQFVGLLGALTLVGALFATNGIVSDDRKHGYYRFLFAKPASVVRFYAIKFATHGIGFLLVGAVFLGIYAAAFRPFLPASFFPALALLFLGIGGIGFLLSATWRVDWLSLIFVILVSGVVWDRLEHVPGWRWLAHLFPPVHKLGDVYKAVAASTALPAGDLLWLAGYGLVCFLLGLVVLRVRPLATE